MTDTIVQTSPTPVLAHFVASTAEDLPEHVIQRARVLLLDGIACGLVGAKLPWARRAVEGIGLVDNGSGATLWGWGRSVSPAAAALLNGTFVQGFELDDFHAHGALHSSSVVVTAGLAAAEVRGDVSLTQLLRALALGYEVGPRVGMAMGGGRLSTIGWHTGAVFGTVAAAVSAGTVFGLDAAQMESAIGNAATRASGLMAAQYKSMVKRMHHGMAAQSGLYGAALASAGFVGTERVLEHEYGGLAATILGEVESADFDKLTSGLGSDWVIETIGIKRHACLIMLHSTIDALIELRAEGLTADKIDHITIHVSESVARRTSWKMEHPGKSLSAQMNLRFGAAVALIDGSAYVDQFSASSLARPEVWHLMDRIDVVHDEAIDSLGRDRRFVTRLDISLSSGKTMQVESIPPQDREFSTDEVITKYRGLVANLIPEKRSRAIEDLVLYGGADRTAAELADLLRQEAAPALPDLDED